MNVRQLPLELQQKAIAELNEDPARLEQDIEDLRSWLKCQPHLKFKDDNQFLLGILRRCKFSIEKSKNKLESYYTMKTFSPEFFKNRDPFKKSFQSMLSTKTVIINSSMCSTLIYASWKLIEDMGVSFLDSLRMCLMYIDILINESDAFIINKFIYVIDFKDVPLKACLKWDLNVLKKYFYFINAYSLRIQNIFVVNASPIIENIYNITKFVLSEKIQAKIFIYNKKNSYKFEESVPRELLPEEFGGTARNSIEIVAEWKKKMESYKEWFIEDEKYESCEELRVGQHKTHSDIFGVEGHFRQLTFD